MLTNELQTIKVAEEKADAMVRSAKLEAVRITDGANSEAIKIVAEAEKRAASRYDELLNEGNLTADREYEEAMAESDVRCRQMADDARAYQASAVDTIIERIVAVSGNR